MPAFSFPKINLHIGTPNAMNVEIRIDENRMLDFIEKLILEERKGRKFSKEEYEIYWSQIIKVGDDIILIDTRNK